MLPFTTVFGQGESHELSFKIVDAVTKKPIENVAMLLEPCSCGGLSDKNGLFSITVKENKYSVKTSFLGFKEDKRIIVVDKNTFVLIELYEQKEQLSEVIIKAKNSNDNLERPQMGAIKLTKQQLIKIPAAIGEFDALRGVTLLAGVNNTGEISNGVSVRGGSLDQNLLLYDYAPVFNPTHLFGLFSIFTPDVISSVDLYRANIPARYGGRTTSVVDIKVKNPYVDKFKLYGGVGLVSSRVNIETPIIKDKLMLVSGVRAGLTDFLLPIFSERLDNTKARFYDGTIKLLYLPTEKDQVSFTGFYSKDFYQLDLVTKIENINSEVNKYDFQTFNGTINWQHNFNDNTSLKAIVVGSKYDAKTLFPEFESTNEIEFDSKINYTSLISEVSKKVTNTVDYYAGIQANQYKIDPGKLDPGSGNSILPIELERETSYELSSYANVNWKPTNNLSLSGGLRYNYFLFQGPFTLNTYDEDGLTILASQTFEKGEKVNTYTSFEPRFGSNLKLGNNTSIKASYARTNQYLQNIYNATTPLPTSRWKTSDPNIEPQNSDSYGLGVYKNIKNNEIELSLETYYRNTRNNLAYKPGADFFLEEFIENDIVQTKGRAYGVELSFKKPRGKINGWFNYTYSKSELRTNENNPRDKINNNNWFVSDFDRPHVFNGTINFEGDKYNTWSLNFTGQTGRPFTLANSVVEVGGINVPVFLERNNARLPSYHRLDFSWKVKYSKKLDKRWVGDWTFTVYNVYGRRNPINAYYSQRNGSENSDVFLDSPLGFFELSVVNSPIFALTYNFTFQ